MRRLDDIITDSMDMSLSKLWEIVKDREAWHAAVHEGTKSRTSPNNRTTTTCVGGRRVKELDIIEHHQYFGHLMQRIDSLQKISMMGGIGGRKKRGRQRNEAVG